MLNKLMHKGVIVMLLVGGLLLTTAAPAALALDKKRCKDRDYYTTSYNDDGQYRDRDYRRDERRYDNRYDSRRYDDRASYDNYYNRDTTGRTLRDVGIGAAIGAGGGALIGGRKGALIGAAVGAGGGYLYNRAKNRSRY